MSGSDDPFGDNDFDPDKIFADSSDPFEETSVQDTGSSSSPFQNMFRKRKGNIDTPIVSSLMCYLFKSASRLHENRFSNGHLRAVYEQLNVSTELETDDLAIHYDLEMRLIDTHRQLRLANLVMVIVDEFNPANNDELARLVMYTECWIDFLKFSLEHLGEQYRLFGVRCGFKIYDSIVDYGRYPYVTPSMEIFGGSPPGSQHYMYGDVSSISDSSHDMLELIVRVTVEHLASHGDSGSLELQTI